MKCQNALKSSCKIMRLLESFSVIVGHVLIDDGVNFVPKFNYLCMIRILGPELEERGRVVFEGSYFSVELIDAVWKDEIVVSAARHFRGKKDSTRLLHTVVSNFCGLAILIGCKRNFFN